MSTEFFLVFDNGDRIRVEKFEDHVVLQSTNEQHIIAEMAKPHGIKVRLNPDTTLDGNKP